MQILHDPRILNFCFLEEKKNGGGQGEIYLPKKDIWFKEGQKNEEGKRGKYQKEKHFFGGEKKEREQQENIGKKKIFFW